MGQGWQLWPISYAGSSYKSKETSIFIFFYVIDLGVNCIVSKKEDLVKAPKILEESRVSKMRYYRDTDCDYYYIEEYGRKIYDDNIV